MEPDLNALAVFALVAEERSFRAAADRLGVTRSAVSQTIRRLEETLGIALVQRTTRSVSLTEAGERLCARSRPPLRRCARRSRRPGSARAPARAAAAGRLIDRGALSRGPFLAAFAEANPEIQIDITVTDEEFDIVAEGYDAGVSLGEVIEQDMIAVSVAGDERQLAVCAPSTATGSGRLRIRASLQAIAASAGALRPRPLRIAGSSPSTARSSALPSRRRSRPTTWR